MLAAARYLEWLGFGELELTEGQERESVTLLGDRLVAQVDSWPEQADMRAVECLWLQTLHAEEMAAAMFTTASTTRTRPPCAASSCWWRSSPWTTAVCRSR